LRENLETFRRGRETGCKLAVVAGDVLLQIKRLAAAPGGFDLIIADPPYGDAAQTLLEQSALPELLAAGGLFVLESAKRDPLAPGPAWKLERQAVYGDTLVSFLNRA